MYKTFKLSLCFTKRSDGGQVYYKIDGQRFRESRTLKLHVDTTYKVFLECRPALDIRSVSICGIKVDGSFTKTDASVSSYSGTWSSGMVQKTSRKVRSFLPVFVTLEDGASIQMSLQCKLYSLKDKTHVVWGTPLTSIDIRCSQKQDESLVSVNEVMFN